MNTQLSNRSKKNQQASRAMFEGLEARRMFAAINWVNRGNDNFDAIYGAKAGSARQLVDVAIADWAHVIQNFNYGDTSHANAFELNIRAADTDSYGIRALGFTWLLKVDSQGKPYGADIVMDDDAGDRTASPGWLIQDKWAPASKFVNKTDYSGKFNLPLVPQPADFYTTILHEIGHAVGIGVGDNLKINQYLTPVPGSPGQLKFQAGTTTAMFGSDNGGHITFTPDLMNASQGDLTRNMITPLDAKILRDAYGYTVWDPNSLVKLGELPAYWGTFCSYYDLTLEPGEGCTVQAISVPPQLDALSNITANEGDLITFQASARDENPGSTFTFSLVNAPAGATIHPQTGEFSFTPTDGPGTYTITVKVGDGGGCGCGGPTDTTMYDTKTMTITVGNVAPTAGAPRRPSRCAGRTCRSR